jgi:sugar lactone lactonase YvrE
MKETLAGFLSVLVLLFCAAPAPAATSPVVLSHSFTAATENGTVNTVSVRIENTSNFALSDLTLSLAVKPPFSGAVRPLTAATLAAHESVNIPLHLIAPKRVKPVEVSERTLAFVGKCRDGMGRALLFAAESRPGRDPYPGTAPPAANPTPAETSAQPESGPGSYILQWGARFHFSTPAAVATDGSGNVYVADSSTVQKLDGNGNILFATGSLSPEGEPCSPEGVAVDSAGNFFVTDSYSNSVRKYDQNGNVLAEWGGSGSGNGQFSQPLGVALDGSGNVYVADQGNNRIQKFGSGGTFLAAWGVDGYPAGITVDRTGNVYVTDRYNSRVLKYDGAGLLLSSWQVTGAAEGLFNNPSGVALDGTGNVYVTNSDGIQLFDARGNLLRRWGSYGSAAGQFNFPFGMTVDSSGNVYVADSFNDRVQKFDGSGKFLYLMGSYGSQAGNFHTPKGVALGADGEVFVADGLNHRIQKFDADGNFVTSWGSYGTENGQLQSPQAVAVDGNGNVYVADRFNNRIQKFDGSGSFLATLVSGQFGIPDGPVGLAVDGKGNLFVADMDNRSVKKFDHGGTLIWASHGCATPGSDGMSPVAIAVQDNGTLYVADAVTEAVQKLDVEGKCVPFSCGDAQFLQIAAVAVDAGGTVYALDRGGGIFEPGKVVACEANGNLRGSFGSYGSGNGEFKYPAALAVGKAGERIYLADTGNNRIQALTGFGPAPPAAQLAVSVPDAGAQVERETGNNSAGDRTDVTNKPKN